MIRLITNGRQQKERTTGSLSKLGSWAFLSIESATTHYRYGSTLHTSEHEMALTAVLEALRGILSPSNVHITVDNDYLMDGATLWLHVWKNNGWKTRTNEVIPYKDLWNALEVCTNFHQKVRWARTHKFNKSEDEQFVEKLCSLAIQEASLGMQ